MDCLEKFMVNAAMPCIEAVITGHLEMLFRDVLDQKLDEINDGEVFPDKNIVFMAVIVKGNGFSVIGINTVQGDDRTAKVAGDITDYGVRVRKRRLCIHVESVFIFTVKESFGLFEGGSDTTFHKI